MVASNNGNASAVIKIVLSLKILLEALKFMDPLQIFEVVNSIIFNNSVENITNERYTRYHIVLLIILQVSVIDLDPLFVDPDNGDFTLQPSSPCINAGDPDSPLDPDGSEKTRYGCFYIK